MEEERHIMIYKINENKNKKGINDRKHSLITYLREDKDDKTVRNKTELEIYEEDEKKVK